MGIDKNKHISSNTVELRRQEEEKLRANKMERQLPGNVEETRRLVHELEVHRIELEMQNAELRQARGELESSLDKFINLFDFAPVGYCTLDCNGIITTVNLACATFLGIDRSRLVGRRFDHFVTQDTRADFTALLNTVIASHTGNSCEVALVKEAKQVLFVQINAVTDGSGQKILVGMVDITKRKLMEEALERSEENTKTILKTAMDGFWVVDSQGCLLEVNKSYSRMSGYSIRELQTMSISDLDAIESGETLALHIQKIKDQGEDRFESRHRRKDGSVYDVEISVQYQPFEGGRFAVFLRDITEIKRAKAEIQRLASFPLMNPNPVLELDETGKITFCNQAAKQLIEDFESDSCCNPLIPHDFPVILQGLREKRTEQYLREIEINGYFFEERICIVPEFQSVRIYSMEITARKQAEKRLRSSEHQLAEAQRITRLGSWQWDATDDKITGSEEFYRIFGCFFSSYRDLLELVHTDDRDNVHQSVRDTYYLKEPHNIFCSIVRPDGAIRIIHAQGEPVTDNSGRVVRVLGTAHDVTERRRVDKALAEKREELEELNLSLNERIVQAVDELRQKDRMLILQERLATMGEMINNIAHQWRQPLNGLGLLIQQLPFFYESAKFNRDFLEENTEKAMQLIRHMSQTIDDFRNFFKSDKVSVSFAISRVIRHALTLIEQSFRELRIEIVLNPEGDPMANGYPNEFAQVILNILLNARDALVENNVDKALITIRTFAEGCLSVVTITDNAGGISDDIIHRLFDPFFTTKGPDKGTGIGLFMSKTIIEKNMGGRLTVRNTGNGAEFRIEL